MQRNSNTWRSFPPSMCQSGYQALRSQGSTGKDPCSQRVNSLEGDADSWAMAMSVHCASTCTVLCPHNGGHLIQTRGQFPERHGI